MRNGERFEERMKRLGIVLPSPPTPVANFVPVCASGNLCFVSGQGPIVDGAPLVVGKVGREVSEEEGYRAARQCALNILAHLRAFHGTLNDVEQVVSVRGYVASADTFLRQPAVINGCSDVLVELFGDAGRHSRCALGVNVLPGDIPVEIEAVVRMLAPS